MFVLTPIYNFHLLPDRRGVHQSSHCPRCPLWLDEVSGPLLSSIAPSKWLQMSWYYSMVQWIFEPKLMEKMGKDMKVLLPRSLTTNYDFLLNSHCVCWKAQQRKMQFFFAGAPRLIISLPLVPISAKPMKNNKQETKNFDARQGISFETWYSNSLDGLLLLIFHVHHQLYLTSTLLMMASIWCKSLVERCTPSIWWWK